MYFRSILFSLIFFLVVSPRFLQAQDTKPWLSEYSSHIQYEDVYVVKKIQVSCRQYDTYLVDSQGRKLTPAYRDIGPFSGGLAEFVVKEGYQNKQGYHGFIDKRGKVVVPPVYLGTDRFVNGITWVIYDAGEQYGLSYIDSTGKEFFTVPVHLFKNDFLKSKATIDYVCNQDTKEDLIWWKNKEIYLLNWNFSPFIEKEIKESDGVYHFLYKGKYGIISKDMVLRVPVVLDGIDPEYEFSGQGLERLQYGDKFGYMDRYTGEIVAPFIFTDTRKPTAGLFWAKKNGKWGCIDKTGKTRIPFLYDEATGFTGEDRSAVAIDGKFGHIDKKGNIRTPLKYDFASYYNHGISMVRVGDRYGYIDIDGKPITPFHFEEALPFDHPTTLAERYGVKYEITTKGEASFAGFNYKWKALFILLGLGLFIYLNNKVFRMGQRRRAAKG
ncbi:WG repeat protein [Dyadobacter jejuensis]|uniref:WG repeat protein n=1 Tax=Dyadobacter jejuensis TaxID=1082580 RepID=A0A316BC44_9BACT|nr:WG repeat-containing protein [Dyadobacter jejuensis]PWJ60047.1 WG repeat protein [Dyadobacter jejuensis]